MTCQAIGRSALNTEATLRFVNKHKIIALRADWTRPSDEIERWLKKFDSISVPLTVILPARRPNKPIVLRDVYTQSMLLQSLHEAVAVSADQASQANRSVMVR